MIDNAISKKAKEEIMKRLRREMDADHIKYVSIDYVERVLNTMKVKDEQQK